MPDESRPTIAGVDDPGGTGNPFFAIDPPRHGAQNPATFKLCHSGSGFSAGSVDPGEAAVSLQRVSLALAALLAAAFVSACKPTASAPPVVAAAPVVAAPLPEGAGCGPTIARTQAVVDSDVATENLNKAVGDRFSADLHRAADACRAGKDREALSLLAVAKSRYGYH